MEPTDRPETNNDREIPLINAARKEAQSLRTPADLDVRPDSGRTETTVTPQSPDGGRTANDVAAPARNTPRRIAHYNVTRIIASGGMGTVYEATQDHPRRTVAIKVLKHGITSGRALRRFEYESQVLASLQHPGIAHVYDAGWHEECGQRTPYFALEYIPNAKSIVEFANQRQLSVHDRLKLFITVCEAVHHGHQRGIIHRDLKPGNILVDPEGQIRIIDFGVARSVGAHLDPKTYETNYGELVGTLKYMSPEQCQADPHDLDTRSDIYALGVVLFELLTGRLPYDLDSAPYRDAPRIICEQPPTRLSSADRSLRGDMETIVNKCLEKDRRHRYQSALALGEDIQRFLDDEPIQARPPSAVYRLRKLVRRRRAPLAAASLFVVMGVTIAAVQARAWATRQEQQRQEEQLRRDRAHLASLAELMEATVPVVTNARPKATFDLMQLCDRVLASDPDNAPTYALRGKLHELRRDYQQAGRDCSRALSLDPDQPIAQCTCAFVALWERGDFQEARRLYEKGLDGYFPTTDLGRYFHQRARLRRLDHEYEKAMLDYDRSVALAPQFIFGWRGRGLLRYMTGDIDRAIADLEQAAEIAESRDHNWQEVVRCRLWIWEMRMRRGADGDQEAADVAFAAAEHAAEYDARTKGWIAVLRQRIASQDHLNSLNGREAPSDRAQAAYYLGVRALIQNEKGQALKYFEQAADPVLHRYDEFDLARWHIRQLTQEDGS